MSSSGNSSAGGSYELLLRYLDGTLSRAEVDDLNHALKMDRLLRRELAMLLIQELHLSEIGLERSMVAQRAVDSARLTPPPFTSPLKWGLPVPLSFLWRWSSFVGLAIVVLTIVAFGVFWQPHRPYLKYAEGDVFIQHRDGRVSVSDGSVLRNGDRVQVKAGASAAIGFRKEGTWLQLEPETDLEFRSTGSGKILYLNAGSFSATIDPQPKPAPLRIFTAFAEATVVGTELIVHADSRATRLEVRKGLVRFARSPGDQSILVKSGQMASAGPGLELSARDLPNGLLREYWLDLPGSDIKDLTNSTRFPDHPSGQEPWSLLEVPIQSGDLYGARFSGFLRPWRSGAYQFWILADDSAELWLSRDAAPERKVKLCEAKTWTTTQQLEERPEQKSIPLLLQAGKSYYIEVLYKQNAGARLLSVEWQGPDGHREVISRAALVPPELSSLVSVKSAGVRGP